MKINEIYAYLKELFPLDTACGFDNVGLLVGDGENEVKNVLIVLDCTKKAVEKAIENNCNLIITHHPIIFNGLKDVVADSTVYNLVRNDISVISMHTNLDIAENGVSEQLCKAIGLTDITSVTASDGFIIKKGVHSPVFADDFAKEISEKLGGRVKYVGSRKKIQNVLVCSGGGGDFLTDAINGGFDALVTADVKHNKFIEAINCEISLFDAGHFETEDVIIEPLKEMLKEQFSQIDFIAYHLDDFKYC